MLVKIATFVSVHGLKGWLKINSFSQKSLKDYQCFYTKEQSLIPIKIHSSPSDTTYLASIDHVISREMAEQWIGQDFYILRKNMNCLEDDEVYYVDILGASVIDENGNNHGIVTHVDNYGAGDVLEIKYNNQTFMCSFHAAEQINEKTFIIHKTSLVSTS